MTDMTTTHTVSVPVEPTEAMLRAGAWRAQLHREANPGDTWEQAAREVFCVMLAAAPAREGEKPLSKAQISELRWMAREEYVATPEGSPSVTRRILAERGLCTISEVYGRPGFYASRITDAGRVAIAPTDIEVLTDTVPADLLAGEIAALTARHEAPAEGAGDAARNAVELLMDVYRAACVYEENDGNPDQENRLSALRKAVQAVDASAYGIANLGPWPWMFVDAALRARSAPEASPQVEAGSNPLSGAFTTVESVGSLTPELREATIHMRFQGPEAAKRAHAALSYLERLHEAALYTHPQPAQTPGVGGALREGVAAIITGFSADHYARETTSPGERGDWKEALSLADRILALTATQPDRAANGGLRACAKTVIEWCDLVVARPDDFRSDRPDANLKGPVFDDLRAALAAGESAK